MTQERQEACRYPWQRQKLLNQQNLYESSKRLPSYKLTPQGIQRLSSKTKSKCDDLIFTFHRKYFVNTSNKFWCQGIMLLTLEKFIM